MAKIPEDVLNGYSAEMRVSFTGARSAAIISKSYTELFIRTINNERDERVMRSE